MDAELAALAGTAGATIVAAMVTDAWEKTRTAVGVLWRRIHPERAEAIDAELVDARAELLAARAAGDGQVERDLVAEWQGRPRRLLVADPGVAGELRCLLAELAPVLPAGTRTWTGNVDIRAEASAAGPFVGHVAVEKGLSDQNRPSGQSDATRRASGGGACPAGRASTSSRA